MITLRAMLATRRYRVILGGWRWGGSGRVPRGTAQVYDTTADKRSQLPALSEIKSGLGVAAVKGVMIAVGGTTGHDGAGRGICSGRVEVYEMTRE